MRCQKVFEKVVLPQYPAEWSKISCTGACGQNILVVFAHSCNEKPQIEKLIELIDVTVGTLARKMAAADKNNIQNWERDDETFFYLLFLLSLH